MVSEISEAYKNLENALKIVQIPESRVTILSYAIDKLIDAKIHAALRDFDDRIHCRGEYDPDW